ncbi:hypothetical protein J6590_019697 [Homalodisca vitripennis]|nr:hypothetical protein J6590_019697 [Homalodisca vitripennis]
MHQFPITSPSLSLPQWSAQHFKPRFVPCLCAARRYSSAVLSGVLSVLITLSAPAHTQPAASFSVLLLLLAICHSANPQHTVVSSLSSRLCLCKCYQCCDENNKSASTLICRLIDNTRLFALQQKIKGCSPPPYGID